MCFLNVLKGKTYFSVVFAGFIEEGYIIEHVTVVMNIVSCRDLDLYCQA